MCGYVGVSGVCGHVCVGVGVGVCVIVLTAAV